VSTTETTVSHLEREASEWKEAARIANAAIEHYQLERNKSEEKLARLLSILNDRSDCDYDTDGTPHPNEANSILSEYQGWLDGWVK
jgi:hypothetical protein